MSRPAISRPRISGPRISRPGAPLSELISATDFEWSRVDSAPGRPAPTNIQWRADRCDAGSILFFRRFDDERSDDEIYRRYLAESQFSTLLTNRQLACFDRLRDKDIHVTRPGAWPAVVDRFCDLIYPMRGRGLCFRGVTGTNGKTTTVRFLDAILRDAGQRVLCIGTLGVSLDGKPVEDTGFTSPPQIELRRLIHAYQDRTDWVVMEISSHSLDQDRVYGIPLQAAAWTNFTRDHLDYHRDESAYFEAKSRILGMIRAGGRLYTTRPGIVARINGHPADGVAVELIEPQRLDADALIAKPFLALEHNRENFALAAALARSALGREDTPFWRSLEPVPGRFECRVIANRTFVIDYAHTPDGLESILSAIRKAFPESRVATLFGCGGDRDKEKRPMMGAAAARYSDLLILTSDNPRYESPEAIIADILADIPGEAPEVILDRADAIAHLLDLLAERPDSEPWVVLIAGKGHEQYIDRNGEKTPYSDQDEIEKGLKRLGWA